MKFGCGFAALGFMFSTLHSFINQKSLILVLKSIFYFLNGYRGELLPINKGGSPLPVFGDFLMPANLLDLIPIKIINTQKNEDGKITILKPKFKNKFMLKYVVPKLNNPNFKVNLDEFGSFVWEQIDGNLTVEKIGENLKKHFKEDIEPVYERLSLFIQSIERYKFIEYKNYDPKQDKIID